MTDHRTAPRFDTTTEAGIVTVHCTGEVDLGSACRFRDVLLAPIHAGALGVVADLTGTTFCDSTVFSALAEAFRAAAARDVPYAIAAGEVAVVRPLHILGLDRVLPLHAGLDAAHAAVRSAGVRTAAPAGP
ncbi:STAS domain-containing protein [Amycolatopsis sp. NPDC004625]|uniref:STAS domain-containing protein n=1 Tax=Amycolatopsis sp. NPDC004625 TaxID=3154670 RepID=UPI0033BA3D43